MGRLGRRGLFAGAGAATVGAVLGGSPVAGGAPPGDPNGAALPGAPAPEGLTEAFPAALSMLRFVSIHHTDWVSFYPTEPLQYVAPGGRRFDGATTGFLAGAIHVPDGAVLRRLDLAVDPKGQEPQFRISRYDGSTASYENVTPSTSATGAGVRVVSVELDVVVDNSQHSYEVFVGLPSPSVIYGSRIGFVLPERPFHPIAPTRVYDSRHGGDALAPNASRVVSVKDGIDASGAVVGTDVVPSGATAVAFNLTATGTTGPNFLSIEPGDALAYTASAINFAGGVDVANASTVAITADREVRVFCGDQSGSTHFIIDLLGYYR